MSASVLIIDAEADFAAQLADVVRKVGLNPIMAADGKVGLDLAKQQMPAAIVVCVELPRMSGYSVCTKIRKDDQLKAVPVIITSSGATPETFESHSRLSTRADDYLKKPFDPAQLIASLKPHIGALMIDPSDEPVDMLDALDETPATLGDDEAFSPEEAAVLDANDEVIDGEDLDNTAEEVISAVLKSPVSLSQPAPSGVTSQSVLEDEALTSVGKLNQPPPMRGAKRVSAPAPAAAPVQASGPSASEVAARRQVESLRAELARTQATLEQANKDREDAIATLEQLRSSHIPSAAPASRELLELKKERNAKDKEILALKQQVSEKEGALLEWRDKESELDENIVRLTEETERLEAVRVASEAKAAAEARSAAATIADLKGRLSESSAREADLDSTVQTLSGDLDGTRRTLEALRQTEAQLRQAQASTEQKLSAAVARGGELEGSLEKSRGETAKMTDERDRTKRELEMRTSQLETRTREHEEVSTQLDVARSEAAANEARLTGDNESLQADVERLTAEGERLTSESDRLTNELNAATAEANSLRDQLQQANDEVERLTKSVAELEGVLQGEMNEKETMRATIEEITAERERTETHLSAAYQRVREDEGIRTKALQALEIAAALLKEAGYTGTAAGEGEGITGATRAPTPA